MAVQSLSEPVRICHWTLTAACGTILTMRKLFLTLLVLSAAVLTLGAQQAKPKNSHVDVANVKISYPNGSLNVPGMVVWAESNQGVDPPVILAKADGNDFVFKDLPYGGYFFFASSIPSQLFAGIQWVTQINASTTNVVLQKLNEPVRPYYVYVHDALGHPLAGITVTFAFSPAIEPRSKLTCTTYVTGTCVVEPRGKWPSTPVTATVSVSGVAPQVFNNLTSYTKPPIFPTFSVMTASEMKDAIKYRKVGGLIPKAAE
jgi:hypothetical protein